MMQGSGYYQRDKTRMRTLYWTVREIIQRTLAIIQWHSFAASNSEGTKYFFSRSFQFCSIFPPRTNICIEYSSTSVTCILKKFVTLVREWHHMFYFANLKKKECSFRLNKPWCSKPSTNPLFKLLKKC